MADLKRKIWQFEHMILDEIYTYVGEKTKRHYVYTAYDITDTGYVVRHAKVFKKARA